MKRRRALLIVILHMLNERRGGGAFLQHNNPRRRHHYPPSCLDVTACKASKKDDSDERSSSNPFRNFFGSSKEPLSKEPETEADKGILSKWFSSRNDDDTKRTMVDSNKLRNRNRSKTREEKRDSKTKAKKVSKPNTNDDTSWMSRIQGTFSFGSNSTKTAEQPSKESSSSNPLSIVQNFWKSNETTRKFQEKWVSVFPKTRIMPGESVPVTVNGLDLLVVASLDGRSLYCIQNSCPHLGTPLETGELLRLPVEDDKRSSGTSDKMILSENDVSNLLSQDGCEDCIVCPLHKTAFALRSGQVRGDWCPYPPVLGAMMGTAKPKNNAAVFGVRTRGKDVQVRFNSPL